MRRLSGFNSIISAAHVGTVHWPIVEDQPHRELYEEDEFVSSSYPADILGGTTEVESAKSRGHNCEEDKHDDLFKTSRVLKDLPESKWQELDRFSPAAMMTAPTQRHSSERFEDQGEAQLPPPLPPEQGSTTRSGRASVSPERFMEQVYAAFDDSDEVHAMRQRPSAVTIDLLNFHSPVCPVCVLHKVFKGVVHPQTNGSDGPELQSTLTSHRTMQGQAILQ